MSSYQRLSLADKRALDLSRVREQPVPCPGACGVQVMPADLLSHLERCSGRGEPGPTAKWVTWGEALKLGVSKKALWCWVHRGDVRVRGERGDRQYLHRDLVVQIARRLLVRRR